MKEALFYEVAGYLITCNLCPHHCNIENGKEGLCEVRRNIDGVLYTMNYGQISSINIDPIEKKPLYEFLSGTETLSIGSYGCNLSCSFCQNFRISKEKPPVVYKSPREIVDIALEKALPSISYTYNEPSIFYEYVLETAKLAREKGIKNILVTNGYIEEQPLIELLPYIDAMNIDLKSFDDSSYRKICKGHLEPVKRTIEIARKQCHIEITTLIVTDMNDREEELQSLFQWLGAMDQDTPLHLSRYFPRYQYHKDATDISFMKKMLQEAEKHLNKVYMGNI